MSSKQFTSIMENICRVKQPVPVPVELTLLLKKKVNANRNKYSLLGRDFTPK